MIGYLIKRILALVLLVGAIIMMPFAGWFAAILLVVLFAFSFIKQGFTDSSVSPGVSFLLIIAGLFALSEGLGLLDKISKDSTVMSFIVIAFCCVALFAGSRIFRGFINKDIASYDMDDRVEKLTRYYPQLMMISAVLRVIIEAARTFFADSLERYISYLDIGVTIGILIFALSILMYIFRTVHVFIKNR